MFLLRQNCSRILCCIVLFFASFQAIAADSLASQKERMTAAERQLAIDINANAISKQRLKFLQANRGPWLKYFENHPVPQDFIRQVELDRNAASAAIEGMAIAVSASQEIVSDTQATIDHLVKKRQRLLLLAQGKNIEDNIEFKELEAQLQLLNQLLTIEKQHIDALKDGKFIAEDRLKFLSLWYNKLQRIHLHQTHIEELAASAAEMTRLQSVLQSWLTKLSTLNHELEQLASSLNPTEKTLRTMQIKILEASERVEMTRNEIWLLRLQNNVQNLRVPKRKAHAITRLSELDRRALKTSHQLKGNRKYISSKKSYLKSKKEEFFGTLPKAELSAALMILKGLDSDYTKQLLLVKSLAAETLIFKQEIKKLLKDQLSVRQELPTFTLDSWLALWRNTFKIPGMIIQAGQTAYKQAIISIAYMDSWLIYLLILGVFVSIGLIAILRKQLSLLSSALQDKRERFSTNVIYVATEILRRNLFVVLAVSFLFALMLFTGAHIRLFILLLIVYLFFKILIDFASLALMETMTDAHGQDVSLFHQLRGALIFGGILSSIVVITHHLPVAYELKALSNRIFMVFVLLAGLIIFVGRRVLPALFVNKLPTRRRYIYHVLRLLSILVPLGLISNAVIGLFGYVELAWQISKFQAYFLVIIAAYLTLRGLIIDGIDYASEFAISRIRNGWVWAEAILKPLDKIIRFGLFILTVVALIRSYELDHNPVFINTLNNLLHGQLFLFGGNAITLLVLLELFIVIAILYWVARWSREFSFRWLYSKARDVGVRNSLAVFTQYIVVMIGVLIGLRVLGLDLKGFAVVAAAFAAGIGFGMRDMASNFFSGVLLLAERPFRTGDIVSLGAFEGRIMHTGIRSLTIRTWDYMDVIVPNSDMFTKPFVNWTHQNSIVRTVIKLNVTRADNPHQINQLIMDVLSVNSQVVESPAPEVLMKDIAESLIEMEVRYYIMVSVNCSRVKVRSEVLFAIWDTFRRHGIHPPIMQYDVAMRQQSSIDGAIDPK